MKTEDISIFVAETLAAKAPKVRAALPGPRDTVPNCRFKDRYAKSEVFWDKGRRHYERSASGIFQSFQETTPSRPPTVKASAVPSTATSPSKKQMVTSPRATIGAAQGAAVRAVASSAVSAAVSAAPTGTSTVHARDLFSGAPNSWSPMRRSASQGRSGCQSPSSVGGHASAPSELVREASRRLFAAFPRSEPHRDNDSVTSSQVKSWSYAPPALREVPTPQSSASMANLLQDRSPSGKDRSPIFGNTSTPARKGVTLTREGWTSRRAAQARNSSPRMKSLLSNDNENGERPPATSRQRSDLGTSPKRQVQTPRGASTPVRPPPTPWATHLQGPQDSEEDKLKLAEVARSCLKTQDLEKRNGERMQLRPTKVKVQTPRGHAGPVPNYAAFDTRTMQVSGAGGVAASARAEICAPEAGIHHRAPSASGYPLQESWSRVQAAANQMAADSASPSWQEPVKPRVNHCYEIMYSEPS